MVDLTAGTAGVRISGVVVDGAIGEARIAKAGARARIGYGGRTEAAACGVGGAIHRLIGDGRGVPQNEIARSIGGSGPAHFQAAAVGVDLEIRWRVFKPGFVAVKSMGHIHFTGVPA